MESKKVILSIFIVVLVSFSEINAAQKYVNKSAINQTKKPSQGEKLIAKMDCVGCHSKDNKLVGPSYKEIAKKYKMTENNVNYLTNKIIKGGSGKWGNIPMGAHPNLKKEEAKSIVRYILSLK